MPLGIISKSKKQYVDPLQEASELAVAATNLFDEAHGQLEISNEILRNEVEVAKFAAQQAAERQKTAEAQLASNGKVQAKLAEFVVA